MIFFFFFGLEIMIGAIVFTRQSGWMDASIKILLIITIQISNTAVFALDSRLSGT